MPAPSLESTVNVDPVAAATEQRESEIDRIDPEPGKVTMPKAGMELRLARLGTRQLFRLLRVMTHGAGAGLVREVLDFKPDESDDREQAARDFGQRMLTLILLAVPDAEDEFIQFLGSMYSPWEFVDKPPIKLTKDEISHNAEVSAKYNEVMFNPDPEDTFELLAAIIKQEQKDIFGLGNRIALLLRTVRAA